jgi:hypothetical protein
MEMARCRTIAASTFRQESVVKPLVFAIVMAATGACFASCDAIYGINRHASLPVAPDLACIEEAIRSVPGVLGVHRRDDDTHTLTLTGVHREELHYFAYDVGRGGATLLLTVYYNGEAELSQHLVRINERPAQAELDAVRPVMIRIEKALEERCGVRPLLVDESLSGVKCDAE